MFDVPRGSFVPVLTARHEATIKQQAPVPEMIDNVSFGPAMFTLPEYTSPPLSEALEATPIEWRSDEAKRDAAAHKMCGMGAAIDGPQEFCQLGFPGHAATGVILYGGAMMDPRSCSPLARMLQILYGFTVVPVFERDLAWDYRSCATGRVDLARAEFPQVDRWILAGHSFGAIAASIDLWSLYSSLGGF
jgi:hypothetical protein